MTTKDLNQESGNKNDLMLFDSKKIAASILKSLKEKSFRDEIGYFDAIYRISKYDSDFRFTITVMYPADVDYELGPKEVYESKSLKLVMKVRNEVRWLLLKKSIKSLFKICFWVLVLLGITELAS